MWGRDTLPSSHFLTLHNIYYREFIRNWRYTGGYPPAALIPMLAARSTIRNHCSHASVNELTARIEIVSGPTRTARNRSLGPYAPPRSFIHAHLAGPSQHDPLYGQIPGCLSPAAIHTGPYTASQRLAIQALNRQPHMARPTAQILVARSHVQICRHIDTRAVFAGSKDHTLAIVNRYQQTGAAQAANRSTCVNRNGREANLLAPDPSPIEFLFRYLTLYEIPQASPAHGRIHTQLSPRWRHRTQP